MEKFIKKIISNKKQIFIMFLFCFVLFSFFPTNYSHAEFAPASNGFSTTNAISGTVGFAIATVVGWIALLLTSAIGIVLLAFVNLMVQVAQYSDFIKAAPVVQGWVIIRDICNMIFILILLIIAFSTILRQEGYSAKKMLPKLLIMAVLINFSKTIFGLLIDFSQVVMLTFVSSFKEGGGYFISAFRVDKWYSLETGSIATGVGVGFNKVDNWSLTIAMIAGVIAAIITLIVVGVMLATLVMRIIMLWIYTILSPLVFLGFAVPGVQKYTGKIWEDFTKQLIVGPVLAFFLWLALVTASSTTGGFDMGMNAGQNNNGVYSASDAAGFCSGVGAFFCNANLQKFIITIGLLMGGLMVAQQMGGAAASIAGKGMDWAKKSANFVTKSPLAVAGWGARKIKASEGRFGGLELNPVNIYKGIKEGFAEKTRKELAEGEAKSANALRQGGLGGLVKGLGASKDMTEAMARGWFGIKGMKLAYQTAKAPERKKELKDLEDKKEEINKELKPVKSELKILEEKNKSGSYMSGDEINRLIALREHKEGKEKEIEDIDIQIKKNKEKTPIRTPYTFGADQGRQKMVREAMSKIGDNDNADDLIDMWRHAKAVGDKEMAAAVFLAAAKNGHSNEIIQAEKGTGKWEDASNTFKGKVYDTDQDGLNTFVREQFMENMGMAEQEALAYQSEFSSICKKVGHFMFAESVGSKNGMLTQKTAEEQELHSRAEARKVDAERYSRDRNRFGYGKEIETEDGKRSFRFNRLGLTTVMENAAIIDVEIGKNRLNKNAAMKMTDDLDTLRDYVTKIAEQEGKKYEDLEYVAKVEIDKSTGEQKVTMKKYADLINAIDKYGNDVKKTGDVEFGIAADEAIKHQNERR